MLGVLGAQHGGDRDALVGLRGRHPDVGDDDVGRRASRSEPCSAGRSAADPTSSRSVGGLDEPDEPVPEQGVVLGQHDAGSHGEQGRARGDHYGDHVSQSGQRPRAAVVVTGSELLTGAIADRNGPWLARELFGLGFEVATRSSSATGRRTSRGAAVRGRRGVALIVTCGGLGPTADDLTGEVVAAFAGGPLELDEEMRAHIAGILARVRARNGFAGPALEAANRKQAMVPRGAVALTPVGTAPGLVVRARSAGRWWSCCPARRGSSRACGPRRSRPRRCRAAGRGPRRRGAGAAVLRPARVGDRGHAARRWSSAPASR